MNVKQKTIPLGGVTVLLGAEEAGLAARLAASLPEGISLTRMEDVSRIDPFLSMRQNANYYKMTMPSEKAARFDELIKLSGLRKREKWERPFRKDMTGEKLLWRIMLTFLLDPGPLLLPHPLRGMTAEQRERFDALLADEAAHGRAIVFTADGLKEIAPLTAPNTVCFAAGEDYLVYTPEEIAARREALGGETLSYEDLAVILTEVDHA